MQSSHNIHPITTHHTHTHNSEPKTHTHTHNACTPHTQANHKHWTTPIKTLPQQTPTHTHMHARESYPHIGHRARGVNWAPATWHTRQLACRRSRVILSSRLTWAKSGGGGAWEQGADNGARWLPGATAMGARNHHAPRSRPRAPKSCCAIGTTAATDRHSSARHLRLGPCTQWPSQAAAAKW
jgi:hypothetical protein